MKNGKEYGKKIVKLFGSLKKKGPKVKKVTYDDPVDSLVYGIISEEISLSAAKAVMKRVREYFVDLNDMRVSRSEEILEVLGQDSEQTHQTASRLLDVLGRIFDKYNTMSLLELKDMGKRQAKKELEELEIGSRFVISYCFMTSLSGHAIPIGPDMLSYLKSNDLVNPGAGGDEVEGFLEGQITAANGYTFYYLLRKKSEKPASKKKTAVKKTEKKTKKAVTKTVKKATKKTKKKTTKKKKS